MLIGERKTIPTPTGLGLACNQLMICRMEEVTESHIHLREEYKQLKREKCRQIVDLDYFSNGSMSQVPYEFDLSHLNTFPDISSFINHPSKLACFIDDDKLSGLLFFPRIINDEGCRYLFNHFLQDAPYKSSHLLKSNLSLPPENLNSLRWLTFGYHHNWNTKVYSEDDKDEIPSLIVELLNCLTSLLRIKWTAEAGIINYYTCKSRIGPHIDFSEKNKQAPLLSLSFGSEAIFLIGEQNKPPLKLILGDGDLLVMGGSSRLAMHAVPKVYCGKKHTCSSEIMRVNLNARQVNFTSSTHYQYDE